MLTRKSRAFISISGLCVVALLVTVISWDTPHVDHVVFFSPATHRRMQMDVYLPPGYTPKHKYPLLMVFCGQDGNQDSWFQDMGIGTTADQLIHAGKIRPLIIVSPELDNSWGIDYSRDVQQFGDYTLGLYESYLTKDVLNYVDTAYSVSENRKDRFLDGLSLGGYVALHLAFNHENLFSKVVAHSPALFINPLPDEVSFLWDTYAAQAINDPITVAEHKDLSQLQIRIDYASDDLPDLLPGIMELQHVLEYRHFSLSFEQLQGQHDVATWRPQVPSDLMFFVDGSKK